MKTICIMLAMLLGGTVSSWSTETPAAAAPNGATQRAATRDMVWIPAGAFLRGSPEDVGPGNEHPQRSLMLDGYWIDRYPVTVAQYRAFCAATRRALPRFPSGYSWAEKSGWDDLALQRHPMVRVSWHDAKAYADWAGLRLPTEAQWEKAARGTDGRNFPWGGMATPKDLQDGWDGSRCVHSPGPGSTQPVGSFPTGASPYGVQDMAGNVFEWCADWYDGAYYRNAPAANPPGPASGRYRVMRGGAWPYLGGSHCAFLFRCANRVYSNPSEAWDDYGFRCVSLAPGP